MAERKTVLLMTNSEYGQANSFLAITYELLQRSNIDIHLASFSPLELRVHDLQERTSKTSKASGSTLTFHLIAGDSMLQSLVRTKATMSFTHRPGMNGAIGCYKTLPEYIVAWTGEEYVQCVDDCVEIIKIVNPDVIVAEILFNQAREACNSMSREYIVLFPNAALEYFSGSQPWLAQFWKIPCVSITKLVLNRSKWLIFNRICSGYPYPVPGISSL